MTCDELHADIINVGRHGSRYASTPAFVADNPLGESYHYPDEAMWIVNSPERRDVVLHPEREGAAG